MFRSSISVYRNVEQGQNKVRNLQPFCVVTHIVIAVTHWVTLSTRSDCSLMLELWGCQATRWSGCLYLKKLAHVTENNHNFDSPPPALCIATLQMYWPQNKNIFWLYNQNIAFALCRQHLRFALNWWTCMQPFDVDMCQNHDPLILSLVHVYILNLVLNLVARRISIKIKIIFWRARILALQKITSILISVGNSSHR